MNSRCASTLFVVAMSIIAVVLGAPTDNTVFDPRQVSAAFLVNNFQASSGDENLQCYCITSLQDAEDNKFEECPKNLPFQAAICLTEYVDTVEYGILHVRGPATESVKPSCGMESKNYTIPNPFAPTPKTLHILDLKVACCETENCNN